MNHIEIPTTIFPRYKEIPNVGLYLKQVIIYINEITEPLLHTSVTPTMLSNYVKLHLVSNPEKKMYNRSQIAAMLFIVLTKNVLTLENIRKLLAMPQINDKFEEIYDYFCTNLTDALTSANTDGRIQPVSEESDEMAQNLFQNIINALVQKIYLDEYFRTIEES